jgi:hypothetical protein
MESSQLSEMQQKGIIGQGAIAKRRICGDYSLGSWQEIVLRTSTIDQDMAQV